MSKETPLMKQYKKIKSENTDSILFFRLGDFYEMFFDDAKLAAKELGLTLTSRNREKGLEVPLAGIPYHSSAQYISKLVKKGYKVAICEQVEDPKASKGIVKREVVKVISPGTVIDIENMDSNSNNYLLGIKFGKESAAIAYIDITTGEFNTTQFESDNLIGDILNEINKINPKEIIMDNINYQIIKEKIDLYTRYNNICLNIVEVSIEESSEEYLKNYFNVVSLNSYNIENKKESINISAFVLEYVWEMQKYNEIPVNKVNYINTLEYMELNLTTQKNLELIKNENEDSNIGSLLWVLDATKTSMGTRLLKKIIKNPLIDKAKILERQNDIQFFIEEILLREEIRTYLKEIYDIERLIGKVILGTENARDLVAMRKSIESALYIADLLPESKKIFSDILIKLSEINSIIKKAIKEEVPFSIREGGIIKDNYNETLDELRTISKDGKKYLLDMESKERAKTGINSLKIGYNKVFGYYIEVTRKNIENVPDNYIRKQTLANAERYITSELKEYENKILNAKDKIEELEYHLFKELSAKVKQEKQILQTLANKLSYLDVIISLATVAVKNSYVRPEISEENVIEIKQGRHPVVEKIIGEEEYIKNDVLLSEEERVAILTGPNMAGKSTYMKQIALIIIMAQIGSYVPADYAKLQIADKVFTRVGASDDLLSGQSTFMVEMTEVANIINNATERSFVILDEVGRGTSTYDGISIAWAITEHIHNKIKAKTIFATHYHELTELEKQLKELVNYRVEVKETDDNSKRRS